MPAESDSRREVVLRVGQCLAVITQTQIDSKIAAQVNAVLHEYVVEPLLQLIAADAEVDRLRVILDVGERQLIERLRCRVQEGKRAEYRRARLAACSTGSMMHDASTESQVMHTARPRHRIGKLKLMTEEVGEPRLSDGERHGTLTSVGRGQRRGLPFCNLIAVQVRDARFVDQSRI